MIAAVTNAKGAAIVIAALSTCGALSSCGSPPPASTGTVSGHLVLSGGPPGALDRPVAGTVIIGVPKTGHYFKWITVGGSGRFSRSVMDGTYPIVGHSPSFGDGTLTCYASPSTVTVTKGAQIVRDVICHMR